MNKPVILSVLLGLLARGAAAPAARRETVGQLVFVTGRVQIRAPGHPAAKGERFTPLAAGDVVDVGPGGTAELVLFENGASFALTAGSTAQVGRMELKPRSGPAPKPQNRYSSAFMQAIRRPLPYRSPSQKRILGTPVRASDEIDTGPRLPTPFSGVRRGPVTLRWSGQVQEENWNLQIDDDRGAVFEKALPSTQHEFTVPGGVLRPGQTYVWSLTAVEGIHNGPRCAALVRLLTPKEGATVTQLEQEAKAMRAAAPADPAPLLLLARAYERLDLLADARAVYQDLQRQQPDDEDTRDALARLEKRIAAIQRSPE
jgi:hypothetical protein